MKIYSRMVFDKDNNLIKSESYEYTGPVALAMPNPNPPPPPPPPPPPVIAPPAITTVRSSGRPLQPSQRGRGVLIQSGTALGAQPLPEDLTQKNLLQPQAQVAANILRLMGGGY